MGGVIDALNSKTFSHLIPVDEIIKKTEKEEAKAVKKINDNIEIVESRLYEISKLQAHIVSIKTSANSLIDPLQLGFSKKIAKTIYPEQSNNEEKCIDNIHTSNNAIIGDISIAVAELATAAYVVIGSDNNIGFNPSGILGLDGQITLTLANQNIPIDIISTDSLDDIIDKINKSILINNLEFIAFKLARPDTSFIEIRSNNTGEANSIDISFNGSGIDKQAEKQGTDAHIYVSSIEYIQQSNRFVDLIDGLSFDIVKTNSLIVPGTLNKTIISIQQDQESIKELIIGFCSKINDLSYFIAKNNQSAYSIADFKYSDPNKTFASFNDKASPLRGSSILNDAQYIFDTLIKRRFDTNKTINSLLDLGFYVKKVKNEEDKFNYNSVQFSDATKFTKIISDDFLGLYNFLVTNVEVIQSNSNKGYIQYIPIDSSATINNSLVIDKIITLNVTYQEQKVINLHAYINNININGIITHNTISNRFDISFNSTMLDGINLSIDASQTDNSIEYSQIIYNPGIVNQIRDQTRYIISDSSQQGSSIIQATYNQDKISNYEKELSKLKEDFKKIIDDIQRQQTSIAQMEQHTNMQLSFLDSLLDK